jgi:predicted Zn finger-like uncharacterized protein
VVVICPKCKTKLKVEDAKISTGGSRFKCPKCSTLLLVKKPVPVREKAFHPEKILIAHSNTSTLSGIVDLLKKHGYQTITASDGIEAMVKTIRELPFLVITEVSLPKIFGFEICKRLKVRPETKGIKFILVSTPYDKNKYKRDPESLYEADDFIEDHRIPELLIDSINTLKEKEPEKEGKKEQTVAVPSREPAAEKPVQKPEPRVAPSAQTPKPTGDEPIERAKRLARTIVSDIYLYNTPKAEAAIKNNRFFSDFASELKEGLKLYESRISQEVRAQGDFFQDIITAFIENKKKSL